MLPSCTVGAKWPTCERLRELDEPIYGDKHTLWERLKKAEAALRARQAKARDYVEKQSARQQALREGREPDVRYVPVPQMPDTEEVERRLITHIPQQLGVSTAHEVMLQMSRTVD